MNKLAQYLNQHLSGEIIVDQSVLDKMSVDSSALQITPEMVAYPRGTNDVRKLLRFSWQLAEKGHKLPVTARGAGHDTTGGAIGSGVIVALTGHMDHIYEFDLKQRLVRLQPGATVAAVQDGLQLQGMTMPEFDTLNRQSTIGGIVSSKRADRDGESWVDQLEVVLANGDVLQTKRLSKRELNKKKGEEGFESDLYRAVDGLIDENKELIDSLDESDLAGYAAIKDVKQKNGSLDLAPLFIASQGTLGIISEMIIKAEVSGDGETVVVAMFDDTAKARDAIDGLEKIGLDRLEYYDETMLAAAQSTGKTFITKEALASEPKAALIVTLSGSARATAKKTKKMTKHFLQFTSAVASSEVANDGELSNISSLAALALQQESRLEAAVPLADGMYVALDRFEKLSTGLAELARKYRIELPLYGRPLDGLWYVRPTINLRTVGGKQIIFKLIDDLAQLAVACGGHLNGEVSEGRSQSYSVQKLYDPEVTKLYAEIKAIFDPNNILNTGVKQPVELRDLAANLRSEYVANVSSGLAHF